MNQICLSVTLQDHGVPDLIDRINSKTPDLVEYRLDCLTDLTALKNVVKHKICPIIATDRSRRSPHESRNLLLYAAEAGFDFVDVDLSHHFADVLAKELKAHHVGVIISYHDVSATPGEDELFGLLESEKEAGGDVCKIVTNANKLGDNLTVLNFINKCAQKARVVSFAMGKLGIASRVLSPIFGAEFTFAALDNESRTADGQLSIDQLRSVWSILGIT